MATTYIIRYETEQAVDANIGNKDCRVKPYIRLVYDTDGPSGKFGIIQTVCPPNVNIQYVQVFLKYNQNFDYSVGGEVELNGVQLQAGDKVWLANQSVPAENGIYIVNSSAWTFNRAVTDEVFVDLGAIATDQIDGDLTRNIVTSYDIDFNTTGFYTITYYVVNSLGVLSKVSRKIRVMQCSASIVPVNRIGITDIQIVAEYDKDIIDNFVDVNDCDACVVSSDNQTIQTTPVTQQEPADTGLFIRRDGKTVFIANQSMGNNRLTNLAPGEDPFDAVNLSQVESLIQLATETLNINRTYIAGENISAYKVVYIHTDGMVYMANSSDVTQMGKIIGITTEAKLDGEEINVVTCGIVTGLNSLTIGGKYFFNTAGSLTTTIPTTGFTQIIGNAISSSIILVNMETPIGL